MRKLLFLPAFVLLFSCGEKDIKEQSKEAIFKYVSSQVGTENIDLKVYQVDTLTEKKRLTIKATEIYSDFKRTKAPILEILEGAVARNKEYYDSYPTQFKASYEKALKELEDQRNEFLPIYKEFETLAEKSKTADSTSLIAYAVYGIVNYTTANNVAKSDSIKIVLNKEFSIIEKDDFLK